MSVRHFDSRITRQINQIAEPYEVTLLNDVILTLTCQKPYYFSLNLDKFCRFKGIGGASRDRTDDPLLAKQVLSQLSYSP